MSVEFELEEVDIASDPAMEAWLDVRNGIEVMPLSVATWRNRESISNERLMIGARQSGGLVGAGSVSWEATHSLSGEGTVRLWVRADARGQGVGTAMLDRLRTFAVDKGIGHLAGRARAADEASVRFAQRRGFEPVGRQQLAVYDLDPAADERRSLENDPPAGITVTSLAEQRAMRRRVYDATAAILTEVPSWGDEPPASFETWCEILDSQVFREDLSLLALEDGEPVGLIEMLDDGDGRLYIGMLSVVPAARRRGIARLLKLELARRAGLDGWRQILTMVDGANEPVVALNEQLGYRNLEPIVLLKGRAVRGAS